jgi:hypothetical protein
MDKQTSAQMAKSMEPARQADKRSQWDRWGWLVLGITIGLALAGLEDLFALLAYLPQR